MVDPGHDLRFPVHAAPAATMEQGSLEGRLSVLPQETEVRGRGGGVMIRKEYSDRPSKEGLSRYKYFKGFYFEDRKSTRLNSSHGYISYAVFCLTKKKYTSTASTKLARHVP